MSTEKTLLKRLRKVEPEGEIRHELGQWQWRKKTGEEWMDLSRDDFYALLAMHNITAAYVQAKEVKRGAQLGNDNALKDEDERLTALLRVKCLPGDLVRWNNAAREAGMKTAAWVRERLG